MCISMHAHLPACALCRHLSSSYRCAATFLTHLRIWLPLSALSKFCHLIVVQRNVVHMGEVVSSSRSPLLSHFSLPLAQMGLSLCGETRDCTVPRFAQTSLQKPVQRHSSNDASLRADENQIGAYLSWVSPSSVWRNTPAYNGAYHCRCSPAVPSLESQSLVWKPVVRPR